MMPAAKRQRTSSTVTTITKVPKSSARRVTTSAKYKIPGYIGSLKNAARTGFPKTMAMVHRYCETISLTALAGATGRYEFSANGIFDPNITGAGHQPQFFDTLAGIYNHYVVTASKCKARFSTPTSVVQAQNVAVFLEDDTSTLSDMDAIQEQADCVLGQAFAGSAPAVLTKYWDAKKWFGGDPLTDPLMAAATTANPTEQTYFCLAVKNVDGSVSSNVYVSVEIEYTVVWDELRQLPTN